MDLKEENIIKIRVAFKKMQTKEDLLNLINYAGSIIFAEKFRKIEIKKLTYYANAEICKKRYKKFIIKKKSGANREISAPVGALKTIQKCLKLIFECIYEPSSHATGFILNKSIVDNAKCHISKHYVYNIDLKDFFPSIHLHRIKACLHNEPFSLSNKKGTDQEALAFLIGKLCTHPIKTADGKIVDALPQGAPTSPIISNIIAQRLDRRLGGLSKKEGVSYTRYADDITFSSNHSVYAKGSDFQLELNRIILDQNLIINEKKVRLQRNLYSQEVTGLIVNNKVNVHRSYVKNLRTILNNWEKTGFKYAEQEFLKRYFIQKQNIKSKKPDMASVIGGKLDYLKMVKGPEDSVYVKLKGRFESLSGLPVKKTKETVIVNEANISVAQPNKELPSQEDTLHSTQLFLLPVKHNPIRLINLLNQFSSNNSPLKYSTHSWDHGQVEGIFKSYNDFIKKAIKQYKTFSFELKELNRNLAGKVYGFLQTDKVGKKGWGIHRIKIGWSSPELKLWCENNTMLNPMEMILPDELQFFVGNQQITTFRQVVNIFKQEIEIREEDNQLKKLLMELVDKHNMSFDFNITYEGLEQRSFFTDVQWFKTALDKVFESMAKRTRHPNIIIKAIDNSETLLISIEQKDSFCTNISYNDIKFSAQNGDLGDMIKYLKNLCDWSIETKFNEGEYRVNYLSAKNNCPHVEETESCLGFKHTFKFYKPNNSNA